MSKPKTPPTDPKTDPTPDTAPPADPTPEPAPTPEPKPSGKTYTKAELEAAQKKAVEDAQKKWESERDLSELERIKKENAELQASIRLRDAKEEVVAMLTAAGNKSPGLAFEAIKGSLQFDDSGRLINGKDLIDNLKTSFPEQFGTEPPAKGIDAGAGTKDGGGEKLTAEKLASMTPDEINKLPWEDVAKVMSEAK